MTTTNFKPNFTSTPIGYTKLLAFGVPIAGQDTSHSYSKDQEFAVPYMQFNFYGSLGEPRDKSTIYIRMNGSFDTALSNPYQETQGIFGTPGGTESALNAISSVKSSFVEALTKQLIGGVGNVAGYVASAGATGKQQVEFLTRQMFNTFQQLIYQGPNFRQFTPAFTMRPTTQKEAEAMIDIIKRFKYASSPKRGDLTPTTNQNAVNSGQTDNTSEAPAIISGSNLSTATAGAPFTFGYPDMCTMDLKLFEGKDIATLFSSKLCVITNVAVTYGSQNKMVFFEGTTPYPSEVTLNLTLREAVLQTANDVTEDKIVI